MSGKVLHEIIAQAALSNGSTNATGKLSFVNCTDELVALVAATHGMRHATTSVMAKHCLAAYDTAYANLLRMLEAK